METFETARLRLRHFADADAEFVRRLVNDEDWLRFIGDRGIRTRDQAVAYIGKMAAMHAREGHGAYLLELKDSGEPIGMAGLFRRPGLEMPDLGFALLPEYRGAGLALEACEAVLRQAWDGLELSRVAAVTMPANTASVRLLEKLGLSFAGMIKLPGDDEELARYSIDRGD